MEKTMLILASASPRRHEILLAAGIRHAVKPAHTPEIRREGEGPAEFVRRLAEEKARAVAAGSSDIVLGADTVVAVDGLIFGKPADEREAAHMLRTLAGRDHHVYTGICLISGEKCVNDVATTRVSFLQMEDSEIEEYTRSGEPNDKAGAYAIQGVASRFIAGIEGCYHNVVGLPVSLVYRHLKTF
jgi:septum formation protein